MVDRGRRGMSDVLDALRSGRRGAAPRHHARPFGLGRGQCRHRQDQGADRPGDAPAARRRAARAHPLPHLHQGGGGGDAQPPGRPARPLGDGRRCDARQGDHRADRRGAAGRAAQPGAPAVRARARCAGRHQHPHHPCLLPGAAEALPARGRRAAGLRGAGRGRGRDPAARAPRTSRSRRWRAPTRRKRCARRWPRSPAASRSPSTPS